MIIYAIVKKGADCQAEHQGTTNSRCSERTRRTRKYASSDDDAVDYEMIRSLRAHLVIRVDRILEIACREAREPGLRGHLTRDRFGESQRTQAEAIRFRQRRGHAAKHRESVHYRCQRIIAKILLKGRLAMNIGD